MYPYTAINLKETKKNKLRDFLSIVDLYGLSHMIAVTNTDKNSYLKLAKMPSGPTISFKIEKYCLSGDVMAITKVKRPLTKSSFHVPLILLNNFNSPLVPTELQEPVKIVSTML